MTDSRSASCEANPNRAAAFSGASVPRVLTAALLGILVLMSGCGTPNGVAASNNPAAVTAVQNHGGDPIATTLPDGQARSDCQSVFQQSPTSANNLVIVADATASSGPLRIPAGLNFSIARTSQDGGSISLIMINGRSGAPIVVLKRAGLSTPQADRSTPSLARIAAAMPSCVADQLARRGTPTAPGTDLYAAMILASELTDNHTTLWLLSDMESNTGQIDLSRGDLQLPYNTAADNAAKTAPLNLKGRPLAISGISNSIPSPGPAARQWLTGYAVRLCINWKASDCNKIHSEPEVTTTTNTANKPADPALVFPAVSKHSGPQTTTTPRATSTSYNTSAPTTTRTVIDTCTWTVPAALTFDGDSATLRPDADAVLTDPINVMRTNPMARLTIIGHTASSNAYTAAQLVTLSKDRANSAATVFYSAGVARGRITTTGVGDTQPLGEDIDPNTGSQIPIQASLERRIDLTITGAQC